MRFGELAQRGKPGLADAQVIGLMLGDIAPLRITTTAGHAHVMRTYADNLVSSVGDIGLTGVPSKNWDVIHQAARVQNTRTLGELGKQPTVTRTSLGK